MRVKEIPNGRVQVNLEIGEEKYECYLPMAELTESKLKSVEWIESDNFIKMFNRDILGKVIKLPAEEQRQE
mgnify:CR=1 FL=1